MKVSDFDFFLPKELLAEYPASKRDASKLMLVDRKTGSITHHHFHEIAQFFKKGDLLLRNSTKVKSVRFLAKKEKMKGASLEVLLLRHIKGTCYEAFIDPLVKVKEGSTLLFGEGEFTAVLSRIIEQRTVELNFNSSPEELEVLLKKHGKMPLPRYIKRKPEEIDFTRYQTVYAEKETALAAPTSGLHFTKELFEDLRKKGVEIQDFNLEIGLGTFNPVYAEEIQEHQMHSEHFSISEETAAAVNLKKEKGERIIALGTTSIRASESAFKNGLLKGGEFDTEIFIYPPYQFQVADALITNFHTPRSTLLMLVCAFGGYDLIMRAYKEAIKNKYRFYSYGDSMMIV
jgi:S-adenosylmethionine:tRNA ribosyltransferase-isomerase